MSWRKYNPGLNLVFAAVLTLFGASRGSCGEEKPLTQAESVALALRQSAQARTALAERDLARIQADRDRPVARPTLNAIASSTVQGPHVLFPLPDYRQATVLPEEAERLDLVVEQPLYRAGLGAARTRFAAESAQAEQNYLKALADLALAVRKAYLNVLQAESGLRAAQEGLDAAQRYETLVQRQIAAGVAKPIDADTVRAQVAEAQAGVSRAEGGVKLARFNFNRTLGRPLDTPFTLQPVDTLPTVPDSPDAAIVTALRSRPELRSLEQSLRAAQAGVSLARLQTRPTVGLRGQLTEQTPTTLVHEHYAALTMEISWPLSDGGKARQDAREARAQAERLAALQEDARQGIVLEVQEAWQRMRDAQAQVVSAREQRDGLEKTDLVAEKAYEVGQGTVVQVQASQREVRSARERELRAIYDLHSAAADFAHAQGQDLTELPRNERGQR
jgi:outer membrane protein TolC